MSAPVFLAPSEALVGEFVTLRGPEGRHAATVRRLTVGERIELTDGLGNRASGSVTAVRRDEVDIRVETRRTDPLRVPRLVVVQALPKGDRGELAVELMTEAGVDEIVPWAAERCVTRWRDERGAKALERWRATAREAAKQSRRSWTPVVAELAPTAQVAARLASATLPLVLHEAAGSPLAGVVPPQSGEVVVVVGPEGGITEAELTEFGVDPYRLGPEVMRTSSAGAIAAAVVLARTSRWV